LKISDQEFFYSRLNKKQKVMKVNVIIHRAEEGGYWAEIPALPGCVTEGDTEEELMADLKDTIEGWLAIANENYTLAPRY
jgi:predicted RNase H-like HicB family nuclease